MDTTYTYLFTKRRLTNAIIYSRPYSFMFWSQFIELTARHQNELRYKADYIYLHRQSHMQNYIHTDHSGSSSCDCVQLKYALFGVMSGCYSAYSFHEFGLCRRGIVSGIACIGLFILQDSYPYVKHKLNASKSIRDFFIH